LPPRWFTRGVKRRPELASYFIGEYPETKDRALALALDDPDLLSRFRDGARLPRGYGFAIDERMVEIPWALANLAGGRVLDAGSALNHPVLLERLMPHLDSLTISTFTGEAEHPGSGAEYVRADLRELPFEDAAFDVVVSVSTLEHVGMDNSAYGSDEPRSADPDRELDRALAELRRVVRPGGRLLITLPYGRAEDHGWLRQFDEAGVDRIVRSLGEGEARLQIYEHGPRGWQPATTEQAAGERYRDPMGRDALEPDCTFAAGAVACLRFDLPR
jgi:SAM-dependent methyltransferase